MLSSFSKDVTQGIRMNYYPPCAEPSKVLDASPHSDARALHYCFKMNYYRHTLIVNISDVIKIMSHGEYKNTEHRAVVNQEEERLSIAALHSLKKGTEIGPLPDIVKTNKALYKTMPLEEFLTLTLSRKIKDSLTLMRTRALSTRILWPVLLSFDNDCEVQGTVQLQQIGYLPVENVQALASKNLMSGEQEGPEVEAEVVSIAESLHIPIINIINHGIADDVIEKVVDTEEFFYLWRRTQLVDRHRGQDFIVSEDQKLDWGDMLFLCGLPACALKKNRIMADQYPIIRVNSIMILQLHDIKCQIRATSVFDGVTLGYDVPQKADSKEHGDRS
ncbi:Peroxidase superfamily protein [Hibiscus syriacus]|uniref:Peroxidase superfamily protein n=1 Tax=Hibiscus syriacus TaxID=106335 RepID=A0A6A3ASE3_HIBSY|nr:Peroxidase superfamily protein [Hibiscus syriacus]